ncbi:ATP-binding protein [Roseovarius aquimarinus]|uniref:ATP-binding protein n=1 Tax=Roseovarius aquimarinus TaxID=1229156 RepID=A0ABW7I9N3_9RHOB
MRTARGRAAPPQAPARLDLRFGASPDQVRAALAEARAFLAAAGMPDAACGTAEIVLAEVLNNVAEHGYDMRGEGEVRLALTLGGTRLAADITDRGKALPGLCPPPGRRPALGGRAADLPEGGFGWFLIHTLTEALHYRRADGRNHLHLEIDLGAQDGCPEQA